MNALCTAPSRAVRNPTTRGESCGFVDESYGPARALRAVWTARGQRGRVAHRLPTLSRLSPTSSTGPTTGDSHTTTPHNPSPRLPPPTVQDNICIPLKPIPTSPTAWLTPIPSGSFPYGIRLVRVAAVPSSTAGQFLSLIPVSPSIKSIPRRLAQDGFEDLLVSGIQAVAHDF